MADFPIRFETARLTVRPFTAADIDAFAAYRNDAQWMRYQGFKGLTRQQYRAALLGPQALANGLQLALVQTGTGALVGDLYVKADAQAAWVGYTVAPAHARQGFHTAHADVAPQNTASIALLRKLGFAQTGIDCEGDLCFALRL